MTYIKVANANDLVRDSMTGAIINTDSAGYERYLKQKENARKRKEQIEQQAEEINNIKSELSDIKSILLAMIENSSKGQ